MPHQSNSSQQTRLHSDKTNLTKLASNKQVLISTQVKVTKQSKKQLQVNSTG